MYGQGHSIRSVQLQLRSTLVGPIPACYEAAHRDDEPHRDLDLVLDRGPVRRVRVPQDARHQDRAVRDAMTSRTARPLST